MNRTEYSDSSVSYLNSYDSSGLAPIFLITIVVVFTAFSILRWRRPQLKTIYDMEKGRYIITRVSRWALRVGAGSGGTYCRGAPVTVYVDFHKLFFTWWPTTNLGAAPCRINQSSSCSLVSFNGGFMENFMVLNSMPYHQFLVTWQYHYDEMEGSFIICERSFISWNSAGTIT